MTDFHSYQTDDEHLPKHQKGDPHENGPVYAAYGNFRGYGLGTSDRVTMVRVPRDAVPVGFSIDSNKNVNINLGNSRNATAYAGNIRIDRPQDNWQVVSRDAQAVGGDGYVYLAVRAAVVEYNINMRMFYTIGKSYPENAGD